MYTTIRYVPSPLAKTSLKQEPVQHVALEKEDPMVLEHWKTGSRYDMPCCAPPLGANLLAKATR